MAVLSVQNLSFTILGLLAVLQLTLTSQQGTPDLFSSSLLFWIATVLLIWQRKERLNWRSSQWSTGLGFCLIGLIGLKSQLLFAEDTFLRLSPLLSLLAWSFLVSGVSGLRQFRKELGLLLFLAVPWEFVYVFDISLLTAKLSAGILWVLGFEVVREGVWITLPTGTIEVYNGCSGVRMIFQLVGIAWLATVLVPMKWKQRLQLVLSAVGIGFILNGFRVALMAVLVALSDMARFEYWHVGTGSLIFSGLGVLLFAAVGWLVLQQGENTVEQR